MHIRVELWKPKPSWNALSQDERMAYMKRVGQAKTKLLKAKATMSLAINDLELPHLAPYPYVSVWMLEDEEGIHQIEAWANEVQWYDYFDQLNAAGKLVPLESLLGTLVTG